MNYLLDTHTFLWFSEDHSNLSVTAKNIITDPDNACFISIASIWEMAIKVSLDRLKIGIEFKELEHELEKYGFEILSVSFEHISQLLKLEFHHRDPFDRLLIAQAQAENYALISMDPEFKKYNVNLIW